VSCANEQVWALLIDYTSGMLDAAGTALVESHIGECPECRDVVNLMMRLSETDHHPSGAFDEHHIPAGLLARYYSSRSSLKQDVIQQIESHLGTCEVCAGELRFLTELESDLGSSVSPDSEGEADGPGETTLFSIVFSRSMASVAIAAALVLAIYGFDRLKPPSEKTLGVKQSAVQLLEAPTRSAGQIQEITRPRRDSVVVLEIRTELGAESNSHSFELLSELEEPLGTQRVQTGAETDTTLRLRTDTRGLPDGVYRLDMRIDNSPTVGDTLREQFLFRIVTDR